MLVQTSVRLIPSILFFQTLLKFVIYEKTKKIKPIGMTVGRVLYLKLSFYFFPLFSFSLSHSNNKGNGERKKCINHILPDYSDYRYLKEKKFRYGEKEISMRLISLYLLFVIDAKKDILSLVSQGVLIRQ